MTRRKMHPHEVDTDVSLVRVLLGGQFPHWASLPLAKLRTSGTVNALYRLGDDMLVRLPRTDWGVGAVEREMRWLGALARQLPVAVPVPLAKGSPAASYPYEWGVYPWLHGRNPAAGDVAAGLAARLADFVQALHGLEMADGPPADRGASLVRWDPPTRAALIALKGEIETVAATAAWERALQAPGWSGPPVWVHGDLMPGNLLVDSRGALAAVIDWGGLGVGDPACDLAVAWNLFTAGGRAVFRRELDVDAATWERGRGWALWTGLVALPYYRDTNPVLAENARFRIGQVLSE